jgi:hypothetical protein
MDSLSIYSYVILKHECAVLRSISPSIVVLDHDNSLTITTITNTIMSPPPSNPPTLFPEPVPGGSIIGSVGSHFAAAFTLYQSQHQHLPQHPQPSQPVQTAPDHSHAPTYTSFNSDFQPPQTQIEAEMDGIIKSLSRTKIEGLVTLAWIRRIPQQEEGKLRGLVSSAVRHGLLSCDDIYATQMNSFARLPTAVWTPFPPA